MSAVQCELRVIPHCPHATPALELFRGALAAEAMDGAVQVVEVVDGQGAVALMFRGSPSFIADGRDLFPSSAPPGFACRVYPTAEGPAGLPSLQDLKAALRSVETRR
ncbi:hypothetical protein ARTHROSP310_02750 [Arthrobacter sp. AD-310]